MYFEFHQNNSGGSFIIDDEKGLGPRVWIEAESALIANAIAEDKGIYFDGVAEGIDCACCGDRWHREWDDEGKALPEVSSYSYSWDDTVYIHKADGTLVKVKENEASSSPHVIKLDY